MGPLTPTTTEKVSNGNDASFKDVIAGIKAYVSYLKSKWLWILLFAIAGGVLGYFYCKSVKPVYVAESSFVLDEENAAKNAGGLASLGVGLNGKSAGFFTATDNIIWLYSTRLMIQKTLLTAVDTGGKKVMLINWFLAESGLQKKYNKNPALSKVKFDFNTIDADSTLSREQNSIINLCAIMIRYNYLKVVPTPKTENVISVNFKSKDELFSALFTKELVQNVNSYYIETKSKKAAREVTLLEKKAEDYKALMSKNMYQVASGYDDAPYANPNRTVLQVEPQRKQVDAKISGEIYGEMVKQLELSRTNLQKQMPLIQIIESPVLPLNNDAPNPELIIPVGFFVGAFLIILWLFARFQLKKMMA
jgi:hypothetical protein